MLLCLNCFKVYNQKTIKNNMCKVKNCYGDIVEIDELFVPVIIELNKKGYNTVACCSSHFDSNSHNAYSSYIYFDDEYKFSSLPDGYMYDQDLYPWVDWKENGYDKRNTIRIEFNKNKDINFNELSKSIINNAVSVLEWAEGLDEIKNELEEKV
jgi:hypothetical protein